MNVKLWRLAHHLTEGLQHRREYKCNNPTSQTLGTLSAIAGELILVQFRVGFKEVIT
ncbi:MAG: hypothetical protein P4L59_20550 [Desulfosporosinus sp.]|nr:hypothetical protein [Desulfosporosinus sp.]